MNKQQKINEVSNLVKCAYCNTQLIRIPSRIKKYHVQYCDRKCQAEHFKETNKGKNNPNFKNIQPKICSYCKKEFMDYGKNRKHCSQKCYSESSKKTYICYYCKKEFKDYTWKKRCKNQFCSKYCMGKSFSQKGSMIKICEICKKEFIIKKSLYNQRVCSYKCVGELRKIINGGKDNPMFIDGRSMDKKLKSYRGEDWKKQRLIAYKRDMGTCQKCGMQIRVAVHHIIPWRIRKNNELENLICLCPVCHMVEENIYRQFNKPSKWILEMIEMRKKDVIALSKEKGYPVLQENIHYLKYGGN